MLDRDSSLGDGSDDSTCARKKSRIIAIEKGIYTARAQTRGGKGEVFMTKMVRSITICWLLFMVVIVAPKAWAQKRSPIIEQIAKAYGLDSYGQIDAIRYTFNLKFPGVDIARTWVFEPKTNKVSFEGKDKDGKAVKVSYVRSDLSNQPEAVKKEIDPSFINDNYWLLFPFHAYWDTSATVTDEGMHKLPVGNGTARRVVVKYPAEAGGYTPGDTWDLYVGKNNRIEQFVFHHGGTAKPQLVKATWTGYKMAGPLLVSTEHRGTADGKPMHLWFSDLAVKLAGSDSWIPAK
jgi:hypothetical protein